MTSAMRLSMLRKPPKGPRKAPTPMRRFPCMVMHTCQMPEVLKRIALNTDTNQFDLNVFFSAEGEAAQFKFKSYVQIWLDLMRGQHMPTTVDELKLGESPPCCSLTCACSPCLATPCGSCPTSQLNLVFIKVARHPSLAEPVYEACHIFG
mgnify:FL=1